jgi:hypothetical protein
MQMRSMRPACFPFPILPNLFTPSLFQQSPDSYSGQQPRPRVRFLTLVARQLLPSAYSGQLALLDLAQVYFNHR